MRGLGVGLTPADFALVVDALDPNRSGSVDLRDLYKELCDAGCGRARSAPNRRLHCIRCANVGLEHDEYVRACACPSVHLCTFAYVRA
jgi:hypothetical protein